MAQNRRNSFRFKMPQKHQSKEGATAESVIIVFESVRN